MIILVEYQFLSLLQYFPTYMSTQKPLKMYHINNFLSQINELTETSILKFISRCQTMDTKK